MRFTFLGPTGTFTETALLSLPEAKNAQRFASNTVLGALNAVEEVQADAAMVPIENSVEGGVSATLDSIAAKDHLRIINEVLVPIQFILVGAKNLELQDIQRISTHTHAWAQVRQWSQEYLPEVDYIPAQSTAAAAYGLLGGYPGYDAAICAPAVAQIHPELKVLAQNIGDNKQAVTRFILVAKNPPIPEPTGADKTTVVIPLDHDRPGALLDLLEQFSTRGINLSRIESRPTGAFLGSYFFSIDADGHIFEERMREALLGIHRVAPGVKFLGSYPRADLRQIQVDDLHSDQAFSAAQQWLDSLLDS